MQWGQVFCALRLAVLFRAAELGWEWRRGGSPPRGTKAVTRPQRSPVGEEAGVESGRGMGTGGSSLDVEVCTNKVLAGAAPVPGRCLGVYRATNRGGKEPSRNKAEGKVRS